MLFLIPLDILRENKREIYKCEKTSGILLTSNDEKFFCSLQLFNPHQQ